MEPQVAVRIFENPKYGTTHGKGLYRRALFNATLEVKNPKLKYLLDFEQFDHWQHRAKTDSDMRALAVVDDTWPNPTTNQLFSWLQHYEPETKTKSAVAGVAMLDLSSNILTLMLVDEARTLELATTLDVKPCKSTQGKNSPQLFATNADTVDDWYTA